MGFDAEDVEVVPGRLAARTPGRFGGTDSFFTPFAASFGGVSLSVSLSVSFSVSFSVSVSTSDTNPVVSSPDRVSTGDSSGGGTWGTSASAMLVIVGI